MKQIILSLSSFALALFILPSCAQMAQMAEQERVKRCSESGAYEKGYNDGTQGASMNSSVFGDCDTAQSENLRASYQKGYKEAARTKPTQIVVPVIEGQYRDRGGRGGWRPDSTETCSTLRVGSQTNCFMDYEGDRRALCEVCIEKKSCFMALNNPTQRGLCEAYRENKSCMMALDAGADREWCEHLKENKGCMMAFNDPTRRRDCERGLIPAEHRFWSR